MISLLFVCPNMFTQTYGITSTLETNQATQTVASSETFPNTPTGLNIFQVGRNIQLKWNFIKNAHRYEVYRAGSRLGYYQKIGESRAPLFVDMYPNASKYENYYKVVAVNNTGSSSQSNAISLETKLFGDNMLFYNAKYDDLNAIGQEINSIHDNRMLYEQFGPDRYAFYFKPGNYIDAGWLKIGYYTQIAGLGKTPLVTRIANLETPASLSTPPNNATQTFWRAAENFTVAAVEPWDDAYFYLKWAVSQAAPFRRMNVERITQFDWWYGWASGGYVADSVFAQRSGSWTQQQWYTRNSELNGGWYGVNWNGVFQGVKNAPGNTWETGTPWPYTTIDTVPIVREKPFLYLGDDGEYKVFVPGLRKDSTGITWSENNMGPGQSLDIDRFYVAKANVDTAATINAALRRGKNIFFTPGIYQLEEPIQVKHGNTIILGTGLATLVPNNDKAAMLIDDVPGVIVAGLMFDAYHSSTYLLQVGPKDSCMDHSANPTSLTDLFFRIGGFLNENVNVDTALEVNSNNVIGDHFWVWRADHGNGVAWDRNTTRNGFVVNGNDVTVYGLFCEHFHQYQTLWNGDNGRTYFYQSETPYDPQAQEQWMSHDGTVKGYSSYKVGNTVNNHFAVGLGIYNVLINTNGASVFLDNAIEVPNKENVVIHNVCIYELGNANGPLVGINNIIDGTGNGTSTGLGGRGFAREVVYDYQNGIARLPNGVTANGIQPADCRDDWNFRLQKLVNQTAELKDECYTRDSWEAYITALNNANKILNDAAATTDSIQQAYNELCNAINRLTKNWGHHDCRKDPTSHWN
jgi:hypothetical protein